MAFEFKTGRTFALVAFGLGVLTAGDAQAQISQAQQSALRNNCRSDYMSNCSSVKPGGIEAVQCLQRHVAKLSPACQSAVNALTPKPAAPQQAAPAPAAAPAAPPPPAAAAPAAPTPARTTAVPPPASAKPPQQPARATTPAPAAAKPKPTAQQQADVKQHCQSDYMARCRGVPTGGVEALQCLQRHSAQLSSSCRSAVAALGGAGASAPKAARTPAAAAAPAAATAAAPPPAMPTPAQQSAIRFSCRGDFMANCRGVPQGGPEAFACLQSNAARLSPDCRTAITAVAEDAPTAAAAAPQPVRPLGPIRRAIRDRMMNQ
jgi:hypothetical protein